MSTGDKPSFKETDPGVISPESPFGNLVSLHLDGKKPAQEARVAQNVLPMLPEGPGNSSRARIGYGRNDDVPAFGSTPAEMEAAMQAIRDRAAAAAAEPDKK